MYSIIQHTQKENCLAMVPLQPLVRNPYSRYKSKLISALKKISIIYNSTSKGTHPLCPIYQCEVFDRTHRYGRDLNPFFEVWKTSESPDTFDIWLSKLDNGEEVPGKEFLRITNKLTANDRPIFIHSVRYLSKKQLKNYEMRIDRQGRILIGPPGHEHHPHSIDRSKEHSYIFIVDPEDRIYIGPYQRGVFSHSSFLSGGAVKSAGTLILNHGKLVALWDDSGHYNSGNYKEGCYELIHKSMQLALRTFAKKGLSLEDVELMLNTSRGNVRKIFIFRALNFLAPTLSKMVSGHSPEENRAILRVNRFSFHLFRIITEEIYTTTQTRKIRRYQLILNRLFNSEQNFGPHHVPSERLKVVIF